MTLERMGEKSHGLPVRERFADWARRTYRSGGAKAYATHMGVDTKTAQNRLAGHFPPPDELDRLVAEWGDDFIGPVFAPALHQYIQRQEAKARENLARIAIARARLQGRDLDAPEPVD